MPTESISEMNDAKVAGKVMKALALPGVRLAETMGEWKSLSVESKAELVANARQFPEQIGCTA